MIGRLIDASIRNRALVLVLLVFLLGAGVWAVRNVAIDAIPDLSDVQVVIRTDFPGQAPRVVEDQVTYPLTTAMLAVPHADTVRGYSMFGTSFVYVVFEDGTDLYWARSRVLEQLSSVAGSLPAAARPSLGPDATGVGWIYQYVLLTGPYCSEHPNGLWYDPEVEDDGSGAHSRWFASRDEAPADVRNRLVRQRVFRGFTVGEDVCPLDGTPLAASQVDLSDLRGLQDWYLRYELTAVEGVSEVASAGGFVKQYQVVVDPRRLRARGVSLAAVKKAVQRSNLDVGGRVMELSETEYMVRGVGYLGSLTEEELQRAQSAGPAPDPTTIATRAVEDLRTARALADLSAVALGASESGAPIYLRDVAEIRVGPELRRGVMEWNGEGETVGGIVVMRHGGNALDTIERVRERLAALEKGLPAGVAVAVGYDRSDLILRAARTLTNTLLEEMLVVTLICILFLLHARSALVAAFVLPAGVLGSLVLMHLLEINANIMSLGGIAIAIGVMVDSSVIMVENAHKHLERARGSSSGPIPAGERAAAIATAAREVGPSLFFSLLIITVSFLPVFALGEQSGRLFRPLAFTKTFAMGLSALLAVTVIPVLMVYFIRERVVPRSVPRRARLALYGVIVVGPALVLALVPLSSLAPYRGYLVAAWVVLAGLFVLPQRLLPESRNPVSRVLERLYEPAFALVMRRPVAAVVIALVVMGATLIPFRQLGSEFMPPLEEGDLLYMPTTDPGISVGKARELLQQTDRLILAFPEVETVMGKLGRADTATDPAPPSMLETTIVLARDKRRWRRVPAGRFYDGWPDWAAWLPSQLLPPTRTITVDEIVYGYEEGDGQRVPGLDDVVRVPGLTNSWTMPIRTRIDMLSTGIKTPVGVKLMGPDLKTLAALAEDVAQLLKTDKRTAEYVTSAFPEKSVGGRYLDIRVDRDAIARYGLAVADVQDVIVSALGGMNVTYTVEGLERYPVNVRYPHELRDDLPALKRTLVAAPSGAQVPLEHLARFELRPGAPMVKSENARLTSWVYVDIAGIDVGTFVEDARRVVDEGVRLPPGYTVVWSGQWEYMEEANRRLTVVLPLAALLIVLLLYGATRSWLRVGIVLLAVPFSLVGAIWLVWALDYDLSLAVWVGVIALAGLDAETGLVMLLYLDRSFERFREAGRMRSVQDLREAIHDGAVRRIRPKTMTVVTTFVGLTPLLFADGAGADTMRRLAVPMIGGLATSFVMELLLYPVLFFAAKRLALARESP